MSFVLSRALEKELIARGLVPKECKLLEVRVEPNAALVVRYEAFVRPDQLDLFADAACAAALNAWSNSTPGRSGP